MCDGCAPPPPPLSAVKVRVLRLIRILAKGDKDTSEAVNDILAQVGCSESEHSKKTSSLSFDLL